MLEWCESNIHLKGFDINIFGVIHVFEEERVYAHTREISFKNGFFFKLKGTFEICSKNIVSTEI